jgi:hypothetical protein
VKGSSPTSRAGGEWEAVEQSYAHAPFVNHFCLVCGLIFIAHRLVDLDLAIIDCSLRKLAL